MNVLSMIVQYCTVCIELLLLFGSLMFIDRFLWLVILLILIVY